MRGTRYEGIGKSYNSVKRHKLNIKSWLLVIIFPAIIIGSLGLFCIAKSLQNNNINYTSYNELGSSTYNVYLKPNEYYTEEFLPEQPKYRYVADLIDHVNVNFKYEMHFSQVLNYSYRYRVDAKVVIMDKADSTKILHEKDYVILDNQTAQNKQNNYVITRAVDLEYQKYNEYVNGYKRDNGVSVVSNLVVTFKVETNEISKEKELNSKLKKNNELSVIIPLNEQTIEISKDPANINKSDIVYDHSVSVHNWYYFGIGACLDLLSIVIFILGIVLLIYNKKVNKTDIYNKTINKYLKEYDRVIITSRRPEIDESTFENKIRVMSIEELLDAQESTGNPIIYYEVIPNHKSYFIIINGNILYKLTISRVWLEENEKQGA